MQSPSALALLVLVLSASAKDVHYVKPDDSSPVDCPGQPCLTLDQYTQPTVTYFTTGSTFVFLAGNHSLKTTVNLTNVSDVTFRGKGENSNDNIIVLSFQYEVAIVCENVTRLVIKRLAFQLHSNETYRQASVFRIASSKEILINFLVFQGRADLGESFARAVDITDSTLTVVSCLFERNSADSGGAIYAVNSTIILVGNAFIANRATYEGGAIYLSLGSLVLNGSVFCENRAEFSGGAICTSVSDVTVNGPNDNNFLHFSTEVPSGNSTCVTGWENSYFIANSAKSEGGAIHISHGNLTLSGLSVFSANKRSLHGGAIYVRIGKFTSLGSALFLKNEATWYGGAIYLGISDASLNGEIVRFEGNAADYGGAIYSTGGQVIATAKLILFGNVAGRKGGGIYIIDCDLVSISANFTNNTAVDCGGAVYVSKGTSAYFKNISAIENSGSALCFGNSNVYFSGRTIISNNTGTFGGGIAITSLNSFFYFSNYTLFDSNRAISGGAIYSSYDTTLTFSGDTLFTHNTADTAGGALYAQGTDIIIMTTVHFSSNLAENGGAMYLNRAVLTIGLAVSVLTSHNHASKYGGGIYHEDSVITTQCNFNNSKYPVNLPYCFIKFESITAYDVAFGLQNKLHSHGDSAGREGSYIYGGLLDRCQININDEETDSSGTVPYKNINQLFLIETPYSHTTLEITSKPYQLCFCDGDFNHCSGVKLIKIYKGQKFSLSLVALDQLRISTKTQISSKVSSTARLQLNQSSQTLTQKCSSLSYNLYSTEDSEELTLYPDGPCHDTGLARAVIHVTFLPCPDGFNKSKEECVCEERLEEYGAQCTIDEGVSIIRGAGSRFWMSALYENGTYEGLILYKTCPVEYCKTERVNISLDNPDVQCYLNHSGVLCGACAANYSLMLGSSRCEECSNAYLALLLPFAAAGVALVVFLSILRLTVATGMIGSVILYANILQVNRKLLLPTNERNVLTVFVAWLNLDLGFETCFYDGMTAYAQTWLQFAFPLYVWILISLIILISRYSITVSKLIGHNPISVLATLLLMSYNKVLKIIIEVYSSLELDYPQNKTKVWLKDASVPYLQSWHLLLTVVTSLVLVFLFLPYTLLLLLGYKLYRFSGRKYLRWLNRLKPLLDSYYAPYKVNTRYWTGFLLLVRCALYIMFSLGAATMSLLAIVITFTALLILMWISVKIYKNKFVNGIEVSLYFNLIILSSATSNSVNSPVLAYSLVGIVFTTTMAIIVYHFHIIYTARSALWLKLKTNVSSFTVTLKLSQNAAPPITHPTDKSSHDQHKIMTKTVIELREPLLENSI